MSYIGADGTTYYNPFILEQGLNEIWYTTSDGNVTTFYIKCYGNSGMTEELTMVENKYNDGIGIMRFNKPIIAAGSLYESSISVQRGGELRYIITLLLPSSLLVIGDDFYLGNISSALTIPENVKSIGDNFYEGTTCPILIMKPATPPSITDATFGNTKVHLIYAPDDSLEAYKSATGWSRMANCIKPMSEYSEE